MWVQPMVLEGEALAMLVEAVFAGGFTISDSMRRIQFDNPFPIQPTLSRPAIAIAEHLAALESAAPRGHEVNGDAHA